MLVNNLDIKKIIKYFSKILIYFLFVGLFLSIFGCSKKDTINYISRKVSYLDTWFCDVFIEKGHYFSVRTKTKPQINATHIFCWEINKKWKPTGFHHRYLWKDPSTARVEKIIYEDKDDWVYQAKVKILDIKYHLWKKKFSTMFPENLTRKQVVDNILYAWKNRYFLNWLKFRWPSIDWKFDIEGYILPWKEIKINTAYPILKR